MGKLSRIHCPKCGYKLRRLEKDSGKKKECLYNCVYCHKKWLITFGNGSPNWSYIFKEVKEEEIIYA